MKQLEFAVINMAPQLKVWKMRPGFARASSTESVHHISWIRRRLEAECDWRRFIQGQRQKQTSLLFRQQFLMHCEPDARHADI
jgi:hypothetical protein